MIRCVGQFNFKDREFADEMTICLEEKGFLLEAIYSDKLVVGYRIFKRESGLEKDTYEFEF